MFKIKIHKKQKPFHNQVALQKYFKDGGDEALRYNYNLNKESIVLDLGGFKGQWASDIFARYQCNIYVFEPVNKFAEQISTRFCKNDKIEVNNFGLASSNRKEVINLAGEGSSIFNKSGQGEEITLVDIYEWLEKNISKEQVVNLMKINIEGGEYELIEGIIKRGLTNRFKNIQVQFHKISEDSLARMRSIQSSLLKSHDPTYQYEFVWENWRLKDSSNP